MRTENEIRASLAEMERMANDAKRMLESNDIVKKSKVLTDRFTNWMIRSEARANILKWVLCLPYLEDQMTSLNSNEPGAVSSHEAEKGICECYDALWYEDEKGIKRCTECNLIRK